MPNQEQPPQIPLELLPNQETMPSDTAYRPEMCQIIINAAKEGKHVAGMCSLLGIKSRDTFYRWIKLYPEFAQAYATARNESQAMYEDIMLAGALGRIEKFNFNAIAMIMNNKFPEDYSRGSSGGGTNVNIGSINTIEQNSVKTLDQQLESVTRRLRRIGFIPNMENTNAFQEQGSGEMDVHQQAENGEGMGLGNSRSEIFTQESEKEEKEIDG